MRVQEGEEEEQRGASVQAMRNLNGEVSAVQAILEKDPCAHFHVDSLCYEEGCLEDADDIFYPGWTDLWQQQQHGLLLRDHIFRVFCKTHLGFNLAVQHDKLVLLPANTQDACQQWMKDESYGLRVKDCYGHPAFSLINKGTGKILKHGKIKGEEVHLMDYNINVRDDDIMWTESQDFGDAFKTLRCASNTLLNLTVSGRGKTLELDTWHKADHQLWKIFPL